MHTHRCGVQAHKAAGAWVLTTGLGFAAFIAMAPAQVAPEPAAAASTPLPESLAALPPLQEPPQPRLDVVPVRTDDPKLPAALLRERPSGVVRVAFDLNTDGSTSNVKVVS